MRSCSEGSLRRLIGLETMRMKKGTQVGAFFSR